MNKKFYINDIENYNSSILKTDYPMYIRKYYEIMSDFTNHIFEMNQVKKIENVLFIIKRGMDLINHVFKILMIYTKNVDLVYFHTKKAYLYYMEFIGQIGNENNVYLKLTSKDAMLFVYKKTIFEINNNYKNKIDLDEIQKDIIDGLSYDIDLINAIYGYIFVNNFKEHCDFFKDEKEKDILTERYKYKKKTNRKTTPSKMHFYFKKIYVDICNILNYFIEINFDDKNITNVFELLICYLINKKVNTRNFTLILYLFLRKYVKNLENDNIKESFLDNLKEKLLSSDNEIYINKSHVKYVNWLYQ